MTPEEALRFTQGAARLRQLRVLEGHASERMNERNVQLADIREAILTATSVKPSDDGPNRWVLSGGTDHDELQLSVVVRLNPPNVWIVTVY